jgi:hypothetical protein
LVGIKTDARGDFLVVDIANVMDGQAEVVQIVSALDACRGGTYFLYSRDQESDENGDNGNHHQQFD